MAEFPHPSTAELLDLHDLIVADSDVTEPGVRSPGDVEYAVDAVGAGIGPRPETVHETAFELLRLLAANHPFVDGNKRTALAAARATYALNGIEFDYDRAIKGTLTALATDATAVDEEAALAYLREHAEPTGSAAPAGSGPVDPAGFDAALVDRAALAEGDGTRRALVRAIGRRDLEAHAGIYAALARE